MPKYLSSLKTAGEIIELMPSALRDQIPEGDLEAIAEPIILEENIFGQEAIPDPTDVPIKYSYSPTSELFTSVQYGDDSYSVL
jgi:hypothetical protein